MKLKDLFEATNHAVPAITLQQAHDEKLFGPVYHGSSEEGRTSIASKGFAVMDDSERANGYPTSNYAAGLPAPIHHLGNGVYFTTTKAIAKNFNTSSTRGLIEYWLKVPRLETINFGAPNTQMKWWVHNGYNFSWDNIQGDKNFSNPTVMRERVRATQNLTHELASKYDAVFFKGQGIRKLLDGNQICVFQPDGKIFRIDNSNVKEIQVGAKVRCIPVEQFKEIYQKDFDNRYKGDEPIKFEIYDEGQFWRIGNKPEPGSWGILIPKDPKNTGTITRDQGHGMYEIKWKKGGTRYNYPKNGLELVS